MNKLIPLSASTAVLSGLLLITGCSDGGGGGGGITVPANAADIDALNAYTLVQRATTTGYAISEATEGNMDPIGSADCTTGTSTNTIKVSGDLYTTPFSESASGKVTLNDCGTYVSGISNTYFIDGTLTVSLSEKVSIAAEEITSTGTVTGNNIGLTISDMVAPTDTVMVNGLKTKRASAQSFYGGGTYTITSQFSYDSLGLKQGFSAQITTPLEGTTNYSGDNCPIKGVVLLTGAAGSQARGTFTNDGNVTIEYHTGDKAWITDTTYACSSFES